MSHALSEGQTEKVIDLFSGRQPHLNQADKHGKWEFSPDEGLISRCASPGQDTIGDIRITYHVTKDFKEGSKVSVLGKLEDNGELRPFGDLKQCFSTPRVGKKDFIETYL
mmetsp:Transcript_1519/g.2216  ORF Transcript_1519/g.2216 Transcript_1519/m.2216 type:complete len:110 (+) Transcript_1519:782-1111(+)